MGHTSTTKSRRYRGPSGSTFAVKKPSAPFTATSIAKHKVAEAAQRATRLQQMSPDELASIENLRDEPAEEDSDWEMADDTFTNILEGRQPLNISHEGGEFGTLADLHSSMRKGRKKRVEYRTRRNREENRNRDFADQIKSFADAYMEWDLHRADPVSSTVEQESSGTYHIHTVDAFDTRHEHLKELRTDKFIGCTLIRHGIVPSAPGTPSVAITIRTLELYRLTHFRCPQLSISAFVKALSDNHSLRFKRYLARQFSIAFDVYLSIRAEVDRRVKEALGRQDADWRIRHTCPACTYRVRDEVRLIFSMLWAMDGNDSLKRILRRMVDPETGERDGPSREHTDSRKVPGDMYISRDEVNKWAREFMEEVKRLTEEEDPDYNPCAERWKNMQEELTNRMWGLFDETGVFMAFCRHGFALIITDMVRSGEQSKYPLACIEKMLNTFGKDLGGGFDIGCHIEITLKNSPLGPLAQALNYKSLVDAFHGHAHNRLCQLSHLATYTKGLGIEDLGVCERAFSRSNGLAGATRYMSIFHRMQAIARYFEDTDHLETYQNLTMFLWNNYKQALDLIKDTPKLLARTMQDLGISNESVFEVWLEEERVYLRGLKTEPAEETLQMEYYQRLVNLWASEADLVAASNIWPSSVPGTKDNTRVIETRRRHVIENHDKNLKAVQALEMRMEITLRWVAGSAECRDAAKLLHMRKYQRTLDVLEGLVVARIFELSKMNRSQTGYRLRKHIGQALQKRSSAIRTALERYNAAAAALTPPRQSLKWDEVVEYAFLSDFDLLRDTRNEIQSRPWASPAGRYAMDCHFNILHAHEEIERLNVEIRRVATHLRDEDHYLHQCEEDTRRINPALAHQIQVHRMLRGRFKVHHEHCLRGITKLAGFTGTITPGQSLDTERGACIFPATSQAPLPSPVPTAIDHENSSFRVTEIEQERLDLEQEADEEEDDEDMARDIMDVLNVSLDGMQLSA